MNASAESPLGLLSFLSFIVSLIAAILAIDMYKLLRTGEFGRTWRLLIIASVMLALLQVLRIAEILDFRAIEIARLNQIVELCFVMMLAYAFYVQRKVFTQEETSHGAGEAESDSADEDDYAPFNEYDDEYNEDKALAEPARNGVSWPSSFRD